MRILPRPQAQAPELTRTRFDITSRDEGADHYGRTYYSEHVTENPDGDALSSLLTNGQHAPVLDVDGPVTVTADGDGTVVVFKLRALKRYPSLERRLDCLVRSELATSATVARTGRVTREATVRFPYRVAALPSRTRGHFHLLLQTQMSWEQARALAFDLSWCGLTDRRHASISSRGDFMYVANSDHTHDTI